MQSMQSLIVALLVVGCAVYASWKLMPAVARRSIASALLKLPLPAAFEGKMRKAATVASGCGCDGCDSAPVKAAGAPQVVNFHPRAKR
jgi:hypothetical protein